MRVLTNDEKIKILEETINGISESNVSVFSCNYLFMILNKVSLISLQIDSISVIRDKALSHYFPTWVIEVKTRLGEHPTFDDKFRDLKPRRVNEYRINLLQSEIEYLKK